MKTLREKKVEAIENHLRYIFGCQETFKDKEGWLRKRTDVAKIILDLLDEVDTEDFFQQLELSDEYRRDGERQINADL